MRQNLERARIARLFILLLTALAGMALPNAQANEPALNNKPQPSILSHGIAMHGSPALPEGFDHLPYANPTAPKGGVLHLAFQGTFDSLNPFNLKAGSTAQGLNTNVFETLMARSYDEPFTLYGLIAQSIETDAERSFVTFHLNPHARFSDGRQITSEDVAFTFNLLKSRGRPQYRIYFTQVHGVETPDSETIRYDLKGNDDRETPLILALMPVLPRHAVDLAKFEDTNLAIPIGSGPYRIDDVTPGERLILKHNEDYWAKDLPIRRGLFNFDTIEITYYRDANSQFEAFRAGLLDYREETSPVRWTNAYDFPSIRDGRAKKESLPIGGPKGIEGFVFNLRHPVFDDIRVREALGLVFDFEWINANLYDGLYTRSKSFFDASELASTGRPASAAERALLAPFPGAAREDILEGTWQPPVTDGSGRDRTYAKRALDELTDAGFTLSNGRLTKNGEPLSFEIMVKDRNREKLALNYADSLRRIGVDARVKLVDEVQYQRRSQKFDFDVMIGSWIASASPGNEQRSRWGSASAGQEASFNLAGVKSPAIDAMILALLAAKTHEEFVTAVRAYDRVLLSGFYIVPLFYASDQWVAASTALAHPDHLPHDGSPVAATLDNWWRKTP